MGLLDWLIGNPDNARKVRWSNPIEVVSHGGNHGDVMDGCSVCWQKASKCQCAPELGRPRRWFE